jgi:hypothetical protein
VVSLLYSFEDINLPPPQANEYLDDESDEDLRPPVSSLLETRPRRRRDSSMAIDLDLSTKHAVTSNTQLQPSSTDSERTLNKASKRKFEAEADALVELVTDSDFRYSRINARPAEVVLLSPQDEKEIAEDYDGMHVDEILEEPYTGDIKKKVEADRVTTSSGFDGKETLAINENVPALPVTTRKALGPSKFQHS